MGNLLGEPGGELLCWGTLKVMKEGYGDGHFSSLGFSWATWGGLVWREGSLAGDVEGYAEKALETGISSHRGPIGETVNGLIYQGL